MRTIHVAREFSSTPGARFVSDGPYSGEEFRKKFLEEPMKKAEAMTVILDGAEGYATSFLEEAFGGLARQYSARKCHQLLTFIAEEEPLLIEEIWSYIDSTDEQ